MINYSDGCEVRDYYCSEGSCTYNYSNRHTDYYDGWVYYCSGDTVRKHQLFHDFYCDNGACIEHTSWAEDQLVENCTDYDGWYCTGDIREYRDYYCSGESCTYTVTSTENCNNNDGCYVYGDGCEVRDYYCSEGSCTYNYSNRHIDGWVDTNITRWVDDPSDQRKEKEQKEQEYHDYTCSNGSCAYTVTATKWVDTGNTRVFFSTGPSANPYPSLSGIHNGTITPFYDINVSTLYTYPSPGTGGHTGYVRIWNGTGWNVTATWDGYVGDWHNITFNQPFILRGNETYNYTIRTGSYPQIIHAESKDVVGGVITCTGFVDINGKRHEGWIPAIKLY